MKTRRIFTKSSSLAPDLFGILVAACICQVAYAEPMSFTTIGSLPGGSFTRPTGISADGSTIVGYGVGAAGQFGFRWTRLGGLQVLQPFLGDPGSRAYDVSADGSTIVGITRVSTGNERAVKWTSPDDPQLITNEVGNPLRSVFGVSADGSSIIGKATFDGYLISENGVFVLPGLTLSGDTNPFGISNNGTVVVGTSSDSTNHGRAVRWTEVDGLQNLGVLPGFDTSWAWEVSADGSTVVGWLDRPSYSRQAFRWTEAGGMQSLGTLPDYQSNQAVGVSADGNVITGNANDAFGNRAWIWTPETGMQDLLDVLAPVLPPNCLLVEAHVSDDGQMLTGWGSINGQGMAWVATIPEPSSGVFLLAVLALTVFARNQSRQRNG